MKPIDSLPRTSGELARYYHVDPKTFRKWMNCNTLKDVKPEAGNYYSIAQVKIIVEHLGRNDE